MRVHLPVAPVEHSGSVSSSHACSVLLRTQLAIAGTCKEIEAYLRVKLTGPATAYPEDQRTAIWERIRVRTLRLVEWPLPTAFSLD